MLIHCVQINSTENVANELHTTTIICHQHICTTSPHTITIIWHHHTPTPYFGIITHQHHHLESSHTHHTSPPSFGITTYAPSSFGITTQPHTPSLSPFGILTRASRSTRHHTPRLSFDITTHTPHVTTHHEYHLASPHTPWSTRHCKFCNIPPFLTT